MHAIAHQVRDVARQHRRIVVHALPAQDPSHVRPPRALARRVRIAFLIRVLVMDAMGRDPEDRPAFERERGAPGQQVLNPLVGLVTAVGQQPVIGHPDAEHAGDDIEDESGEDRAGVDEEERRDGPDVKAGHRRRRNPVQSLWYFRPSIQSRHGHPRQLRQLARRRARIDLSSGWRGGT